MFDTLLIANRGEIAVRIIRTARDMGLRCVAVYSEVDVDALHVRMADAAVCIGGAAPADSYLRGEKIIAAAKATGAGAIHPGYGFLSENPEFVEQVAAAGLVFVGPSADAIRAMGLKDRAKVLMEKAGVPVVPGYHGADQDDAHLEGEAAKVGYPILIKAVAGGGGKGMRLVEEPGAFAENLASARAEAKTAFGNTDVLIEKFVQSPRHIEVQVFGDGKTAVHLYERDCSLQRRHQKVIEEAPAPGMTDEVRAAMGDAAVRAAEAIGYSGAGTIEFIVDGSEGLRSDRFWFMEMNTRLQVEHPVTEAVTGVDLVEWQLRVAMGQGLPAAQDQITLTGHAFEARLYAEDVPAGFLPAIGRLDHLQFGKGARADTGVEAGDVISPYYDPMISKVIVQGANRDEALGRLADALAGTQVAGVVTNVAFLHALATHKGFAAGQFDTGLIARDLAALTEVDAASPQVLAQGALIVAGLWDAPGALSGFNLWGAVARQIALEPENAVLWIDGPRAVRIEIAGVLVAARYGPGGWRFDGRRAVEFARAGDVVTLFDGVGRVVRRIDPLDRDASAGMGGDAVEAPMPGLVREIAVQIGDTVEDGQRLAVLEAMKMEHVLRAPRSGVVAGVSVVVGAQVEAGALLVLLEPEEGAE